LHQALGVKAGKLAELGAVVKQTRIEKVGAHATGLGLELTELEHPAVERELHKCLSQRIPRCQLGRHGKFLVHTHQPQPQWDPLGQPQRA